MPVQAATTGRVRSARTVRSTRGTSSSVRAIAACTTTTAFLGLLFVLSACLRTKPLSGRRSKNGKTGIIGGGAGGSAWRTRSVPPSHERMAVASPIRVLFFGRKLNNYRLWRFFFVFSTKCSVSSQRIPSAPFIFASVLSYLQPLLSAKKGNVIPQSRVNRLRNVSCELAYAESP